MKYMNVQHVVTSKLAHLEVSFTLNNEQLESEMTLRCARTAHDTKILRDVKDCGQYLNNMKSFTSET